MHRLSTLVVSAVAGGVLLASGCGSVDPHATRAPGTSASTTEIPTGTAPVPVTDDTATPTLPTTGSGSKSTTGTAHVIGSATDEEFDGVAAVIITFEPDPACDGCTTDSAVTQEDGSYALDLTPGTYTISCVA